MVVWMLRSGRQDCPMGQQLKPLNLRYHYLDLASSGLADILASNSAYAAATVPGGMYAGNDTDLASWG